MTKKQLVELAEYYRGRHNEICQDDYMIEKPDYSLFLSSFNKGDENDWSNVWFTVYDRYYE